MDFTKEVKTYRIATIISSLLWISNGVITILSIANSYIGIYINIIVGLIFIAIGIFTIYKSNIILKIYHEKTTSKNIGNSFSKLLYLESAYTFISISIALLIISAITHRAFVEHFAVFG